jgi:hypothetical protein
MPKKKEAKRLKTNAAWHDLNKMPFRPTIEARVRWHVEHAKACACRPIPKGVLEAIECLKQGANPDADRRPKDGLKG